MHFPSKLAFTLLVLMSACSMAFAQNAGSATEDLLRRLQQYPKPYSLFISNRVEDAIDALNEEQGQHENDGDFYYILGVLQLKARQHSNAANSLERAVMINPDNAGAWLDLSIANLEAGNLAIARDYLAYTETNFAPPPTVQAVINRYKEKIAHAMQPPKQWQHAFEFSVGRDGNANSGLQTSSLPVTYGGERFDLVLDPSLRAKADNFAQLSLNTRFRSVSEKDAFDFSFGMRDRSYHAEHAFSNAGLSSGLAWQRAVKLGMHSLGASIDYDALGGKGLLKNFRLSTGLDRAWNNCRYGVALEQEWRRYISVGGLNANVSWGQLGGACELVSKDIIWHVALVSRVGIDKPIENRAGGKTNRKETVVQLGGKFAPRYQFDLTWNLSNTIDQLGYSPLLENNARREILRHTYRAQVVMQITTDLDMFFRLDKNIIRSNLALFTQSGLLYSLGIQRRF